MSKVTGEIVKKYLAENNELPSLTLAKIIFRENPLDFKDVEAVRSLIRMYRHRLGGKNRATVKDKTFTKEVGSYAPFKMPQPESKDYEPYVLPKKLNNIGILSDFHIPNHREVPLNLAVNYLRKKKINCLILNGDILDNTPFSRHDCERPTPADVKRWFDQTELMFEWLRDQFPGIQIIWTEGNHDFWYRRWLVSHAHQLSKDPYFDLQERLHISEYEITFVPQTSFVKAGKLNIMHGHQLAGKWGVGVAPARTVFNKTKQSTLISHVHVADSYTDNNLDKEISTCFTTGCLCTLTPDYQPIGGKACHGFSHVLIEDNRDFKVDNFRIYKDKIL